MVREILGCTPERTSVATNWFFILSGSSGQGSAPTCTGTALEMPEMERYALSEARPWRFFLLETQNSTLEVLTKAASDPEGDRSSRWVRSAPAEKEPEGRDRGRSPYGREAVFVGTSRVEF